MSDIDRDTLSEEFNLDPTNRIEVLGPEETFESEFEDSEDPNKILIDNIDRANRMLDQVEEELLNGNFSARLVEVAGQLINTVTNSSKEILTSENYKKYLHIRKKMLLLQKEKIKLLENKKTGRNTLLITDRESILSIINKDGAQKLLERN